MKPNIISELGSRLRSAVIALLLLACAVSGPAHALVTNFESTEGPAVAVFNGKIFMAMTGTNAQHSIYLAYSTDGTTWSNFYTLGNNTSVPNAAPALAAFNNKLYITWTGGGNYVNIASSTDGITFSNQSVIFSGTYNALGSTALAVANNKLYIAFAGITAVAGVSNPVWSSYSSNGVTWTAPQEHSFGANGSQWSPGLGSWVGTGVTLAFTTVATQVNPNRELLAMGVSGGGTPALNFPIPNSGQPAIPYISGPGVGSLGNTLYVIWPGTSLANEVIVTSYQWNGSIITYLNQVHTGQTCIGNPAILGFNGHVYYAWTGTDPGHHVNFSLYQ